MRRANRSFAFAVGLALLQGCGSCVDGSSQSTPAPAGSIGPGAKSMMGTEATEGDLLGPDGGSKMARHYKKAAKDADAE